MLQTIPVQKRKSIKGQSLVEIVFAVFLALTCALIFASTAPIANVTRGKADYINSATSLAQKSIESVRSAGYANATPERMYSNGVIESLTLKDISSYPFGLQGENAYQATNVDGGQIDSPATVLPEGRAYVVYDQADLDLRSISVIVAWKEDGDWRSVRLSTLVANL